MIKDNFNYYLVMENNGISIYINDFSMFYYSIDNSELHEFKPYVVQNKQITYKGKSIILEDINDLKNIIDKRCSSEFSKEVISYVKNKLKENIDNCLNRINEIDKLSIGSIKNKSKKESKRKIKINISLCKDIKYIGENEIITFYNFYKTTINNNDFIIDIYRTDINNYYVRIIDITNDYKQINFNEFKRNYSQPSLFDFLDI